MALEILPVLFLLCEVKVSAVKGVYLVSYEYRNINKYVEI